MKYTSTRGGVSGLSFEDALFSGFAPDGGLFVPESIPQIAPETLHEWREAKLTYEQVVGKVVRLFVTSDEIPDETLELCVKNAYKKFSSSRVIHVSSLRTQIPTTSLQNPSPSVSITTSPSGAGGAAAAASSALKENERLVNIAELYHGRTGSFKDLALSLVGQFMQYFVNKRKSHVTILIGTSGDTGSAAIEAVRGMPGVDIIVLFPKGMVTPVQELQMITVQDENVHVFEVEGSSDDLDIPIKQCFPQSGLTSINSINWARIMIQIAHNVYIYLLEGVEVDIIVPTGAAGNLVSGVMANFMGVPLTLHAATNKNDIVDVLLRDGDLVMGGQVIQTPASAMDIRNPYNIERLLYLYSDAPTVASIMERAEVGTGNVNIPPQIMTRISRVIRSSMSVDTALIFQTIKNCWEENHYMVCPHTATGLALFYHQLAGTGTGTGTGSAGRSGGKGHNPVYILSTATPAKFHESSQEAGITPQEWNGLQLLQTLQDTPKKIPKEMKKGDDWLQILQNEINFIKYSRL